MPHFTCPFDLHLGPKSGGHPIPQETRHFILNVLNELLNDLRDVQVVLAENDTRAVRVDAATKLLTVVDTSLRASHGSVEVKMPKVIANIDIEIQIATIYEWLAGLLAQSQAVFVAPHRTIERFTARLHDAAKSTRKNQSNFLDEAETRKDLERKEAEKPGPVCGNDPSAAPQSLADTHEQLSEKRKGELPVHDYEADANNTASASDHPDSSLAPQGTKGNVSRTVRFDEDVNVGERASPGLRERIAASHQVVEERYFRRSNPLLTREPRSESPAESEIIDESCFEDLSLANVAHLDNAIDDGVTDVNEDIWSFAAHLPKKPIEKDGSAEKTAAEHAQVQAEERTKQIIRNFHDAYEQRVANGANDRWAWIDESKPNPTFKESTHQDTAFYQPTPESLKSARSDSNEPPCKEQPDVAVDPAFRTAGLGRFPNASRAESVQRQVEDMNQRSQQRKLHAPPTDFPGSAERENELLRQLKEDGLSHNDRSTASIESQGQLANRGEGTLMQVLPSTNDVAFESLHHMSIDEVLASEARLSRAVIDRMDEHMSPARATPRAGHGCAGTQGAHMEITGGEIDPPAGDSPRSPSRQSSVVGVTHCSPWRQAVAEALVEGKGASRRDSWTGEGYRFLP